MAHWPGKLGLEDSCAGGVFWRRQLCSSGAVKCPDFPHFYPIPGDASKVHEFQIPLLSTILFCLVL